VVVTLENGDVITDEMAVADAHPLGARPFKRPDYIRKFRALAEGVIAPAEQDRFIAAAERLAILKPGELDQLTFTADATLLGDRGSRGIFDWHGGPALRASGN
jgi:2-methylcitrate dehydratase